MRHSPRAAESANYVAYYRVSTQQQGVSGLGLEAQVRTVTDYVDRISGAKILSSFTEVESGRRKDRPELRKALALGRKRKATLIVAKLDRLARNAAFISALLEAGVDFLAVDFPRADRVVLQILAAIGEYEARLISERTKAGLESRRRRGFALGNTRNLRIHQSPAPELNRARAQAEAERLRPIIDALKREGIGSARAICRALNDRGYVTARGMSFYPGTVLAVLKRLKGGANVEHI